MQRPGILVVQTGSGQCKVPEAREHPVYLKSCKGNGVSEGECPFRGGRGGGRAGVMGHLDFGQSAKHRVFQTSNMMWFVLIKAPPAETVERKRRPRRPLGGWAV